LYAISDLHLGFPENREALEGLSPHPEDWLVLGGDVGESMKHLELALEKTTERFARVIWVPGNHELWSNGSHPLRGQGKYDALVDLCRSSSVLTPEDPYPVWEGEGGPLVVAPLFLLYDYSFRPPHVSREGAVAWAAESGVVCADERFLDPHPHASIDAWCQARCEAAESRLEEAAKAAPLVLVNHFPLREDLVRLWRIPRFSIWCGTRRTEDWHLRFRARVVVSGHLHVRSTDWIDGVRFEEVSLGYPRHWTRSRPIDSYLREILPARGARPGERSHGARGGSRSRGGVRG
jgi:3',5'-cyclic AMP phosphodiesterase CpdA